jgi:cellulose synthase/poly-beta-1,6-N-acetylglucosamine synthase-like glycosyltransferase
LGANGAIYAIRRDLYVPLRSNTIVDDFCISMTIAAKGWRMVYEPAAQAVEEIPPQISDEFTRRVRIGIGNYQAFFRHPEYLFRVGAVRAWAYMSHKVLRWFTPHLLLLAILSNALLASRPLYAPLLVMQLLGYGLIAALCLFGLRRSVARPLRVPIFLAALNAAFVVAFYRYITGHYSGSWKRTVRA